MCQNLNQQNTCCIFPVIIFEVNNLALQLIRSLAHPLLLSHTCVSESGWHWLAYSAPSHYQNQCWVIVNWTIRNKLQWNFSQIRKFSFTKIHLIPSSAKWWPFYRAGDELSMTANYNPVIQVLLLGTKHSDMKRSILFMLISCFSSAGEQQGIWISFCLLTTIPRVKR